MQSGLLKSLAGSLFFLIVSLNAFSQNAYTIKFKITGLKDSVCYLYHHYGKGQYVSKDTAKADADGNLLFQGKTKLPEGVYALVLPKTYFDLLITSEQNFSIETDTADIINTMKVTGSAENKLFSDFQKEMARRHKEVDPYAKALKTAKSQDSITMLRKKVEEVEKAVMDYRKNLVKNNPASFTSKIVKATFEPEIPEAPLLPNGKTDSTFAFRYYKAHYFDNMDLSDERLLRTPFFHNKIERYIKNLTVQIPDSINKAADELLSKVTNKELYRYCVWFITNTYESSEIMGMDAVFVHMAENYYLAGKIQGADTSMLNKMKGRVAILKPILLGKKAPNLYLTDTTNKVAELHKIKSKYLVLFFYDPDCGHCRKTTPELLEFYKKNKSKGVQIYAASIARKDEPWRKFIKEFKVQDWINVWDSLTVTDFNKVYDVYSTPVIYVLDENKKIIAKRLGVDQLEGFIDNYSKDLLEKISNKTN